MEMSVSIKGNPPIMKVIEDLPEELELTESQWYEYHYYLKRNVFLLEKILALPFKSQDIYVEEPLESYIGSVLSTYGFHVHHHCPNGFHSFESLSNPFHETEVVEAPPEAYDVVLLLYVLENHPAYPETYLAEKLSLLKKHGRVLLMAENVAQFKNRVKLLLGMSLFPPATQVEENSYRMFGLTDLMGIFSRLDMRVLRWEYMSPYPPYRMEPLTLKRYLVKYLNYFVMKAVPGFRDVLFIEAEKRSPLQ
jgi:hypothetical protein